MKNYPLIRKVRDHIRAHPEEHNQDQWGTWTSCGTTHCVAGHAVILAGAKPTWDLHEHGGYSMRAVEYDGRMWSVGDLAQHLLGINSDQADDLFFVFNDAGALDMLDRFAKEDE